MRLVQLKAAARMHTQGLLFVKGKTYNLEDEAAEAVLALESETGVPYFREVHTNEDGEVVGAKPTVRKETPVDVEAAKEAPEYTPSKDKGSTRTIRTGASKGKTAAKDTAKAEDDNGEAVSV